MVMSRLFLKVKRCFWSTRTKKSITLFGLGFLGTLLLWTLTSEFLAYQIVSLSWKWPKPYPDDLVQTDDSALLRRSMLIDGVHHYVMGSHEQEVVGGIGNAHHYKNRNSKVSHDFKLLILSDPHIMCSHNKEEWWIARWDADGYLKRSFSFLYSQFQSDMVIFLGDIFSNGFESSQSQWEDYIQCLQDIYPVFSSREREKVIAVMGDNDIGGEGRDLMTQTAYRRYVETFGDLNAVFDITSSIRIIKLTTTCFLRGPLTDAERDCRVSLTSFLDQYLQHHSNAPAVTILLTHIPLNQLSAVAHSHHHGKPVDITTKILLTLQPDIVLSGHVHHEEYTSHVSNVEDVVVSEVSVPTCSYRMGEAYSGVGAMTISEGGNIAYTVNWLPSRYPFIVGYSILGVCLLIVVLCLLITRHR